MVHGSCCSCFSLTPRREACYASKVVNLRIGGSSCRPPCSDRADSVSKKCWKSVEWNVESPAKRRIVQLLAVLQGAVKLRGQRARGAEKVG